MPLEQLSKADQDFVKSQGNNATKQKRATPLRQIPLVMQRVFLADFSDETIAKEKVLARLDSEAQYDAADDIAATLVGAKLSGWSAGYEFTPIQTLKKGEKPRTIIEGLKTDSNVVLLVRVSTRTADFGSAAVITVFADASLYETKTLEPVVDAGFMGIQKIDPKEIEGDKVHGEYWIKTVASTFSRNFDQRFLSKVQQSLNGQEITGEITSLRESMQSTPFKPAITELEGGDERAPELNLALTTPGANGIAYLVSKNGDHQRRWLLGPAQEVDVHIKPDDYTVFFAVGSADAPRLYVDQVTIQFKKKYSYVLAK